MDAAGDLEFFLELAELIVALQSAIDSDVAEGSEEDGEAYGFDAIAIPDQAGVLQDSGDVVEESEGDEDCDTAADDDEVSAGIFPPQRFNDEGEEREDDDPVVDAVVCRLRAKQDGGEEEIEEG